MTLARNALSTGLGRWLDRTIGPQDPAPHAGLTGLTLRGPLVHGEYYAPIHFRRPFADFSQLWPHGLDPDASAGGARCLDP